MNVTRYAVVAGLLFAVALPLAAQQPPPPPRTPDAPRPAQMRRLGGLNVEAALRHKDLLKLTDAQASQLEALRKEIVAERQAAARDRIDLLSRVAAGLISREDVHKQFDAKAEAMHQTMQQRQDRISKLLTEEQRDVLQRTTHRHMMERMQGRRGMRRGMMRHGFGDGAGPQPPMPPRPPRD